MSVHIRSAALSCMLLSLASHAGAQDKLEQLFNPQMLGANHNYFASIAGPVERTFRNQHQYLIEGCSLTTEVTYGQISLLHLELSPDCHANLSGLLGTHYDPAQPPNVADFSQALGSLEFYSNCLSHCDKATTPAVYGLWKSGKADGFEQISIEMLINTPAAQKASQAWQAEMRQDKRERFIENTWVNCVRDYDSAATTLFADIQVNAISIGRQLYKPRCSI